MDFYVCMYVCMYVYAQIYESVCVLMYACVYVCICMQRQYVYIHTCKKSHIDTNTYLQYVCVYTYLQKEPYGHEHQPRGDTPERIHNGQRQRLHQHCSQTRLSPATRRVRFPAILCPTIIIQG
jgi:hypothetical protein